MKYSSLMLAIFLLCASIAKATDLSMGFKAGPAMSNQDFDYKSGFTWDFDYRSGLEAGGFIEVPLVRGISIQSAFLYCPGGFKAEVPEVDELGVATGRSVTVKPRIDYLSVPVVVRASPSSKKVAPYLIAGPRLNFQIGVDGSYFADVYSDIAEITIGLTLGVGTEMRINRKAAILVELQYCPDFTNLYDPDTAPPDATLGSIKNRAISILVGVKFGTIVP